MKVERILFPTDFSTGSFHALPYAADFARTYKAKLYIFNVVFDVTQATSSHVPHVSADELHREMNEWAMKEMDTCCIEHVRGLPDVEKVVVKGIPYEEIIKFASDKKIDIIVMGTYGRKGFEKFIFGSTVDKVVRKAPCPVLTVRVPEHRAKK